MANKIKSYIYNSLIFIFIFTVVTVQNVNGQTIPTFPSCLNPQGSIKASYSTGTHGVPGDSKTHTGADAVYLLSENALTQCLCSDEGNGIQTNWWKISQLSDREIEAMKVDGWIYVPNGSLWGLSEGPYLAKNNTYSCIGGSGGSNGTGGSGGSSGSSQSTHVSELAGLASTGNIAALYLYSISGITLLSLGIYLQLLKSRATNE